VGQEVDGRRNQAGVTLVELMTVVAIIGLVTALALPSYKSWNARVNLKEALLELNSNLSVARMAAMNRNTTITVTVGLSGGRVNATFTNPGNTSATCLADRSNCVLPTQVMPADVTQVGGTTTFQFNSMGMRVGGGTANQTITLTNRDNMTFSIQVSPAGRTRWCVSATCT
jgi:type IV fimbrial biogenesis protein FimT